MDVSRQKTFFLTRFGIEATQIFNIWEGMMRSITSARPEDKLKRINEFFNRRLQWGVDKKIWGVDDYWATPMESLGKGAGDSKDIAIAKYYSLLTAGLPSKTLRLVYAKTNVQTSDSTEDQVHVVLAYYPAPDAEPLILDNLITEIRPASRRPDLTPVFTLSSEGADVKENQPGSGSTVNSNWQDLMRRAKDEGFGS